MMGSCSSCENYRTTINNFFTTCIYGVRLNPLCECQKYNHKTKFETLTIPKLKTISGENAREYTFYEALREVMDSKGEKTMSWGDIVMLKVRDTLLFKNTMFLEMSSKDINTGYTNATWMEYEPPVDWSKVAVDTKIEVSDNGVEWRKKHFSCFDAGLVRAFTNGQTSFTSTSIGCCWKYARLYKE